MKFSQFFAIAGTAIMLMTVLIGLSIELEMPVIQYVATPVIMISTGLTVRAVIAHRRKKLRTGAVDSFEMQADIVARAASFRDGLVVVALAGAAAVIFPTWPTWVYFALVLMVLAADYWIRYGLQLRRAGSPAHADHE